MLITSKQTAGLGWFHTPTARREPRLALRSQAASRCPPRGVGVLGGLAPPQGAEVSCRPVLSLMW